MSKIRKILLVLLTAVFVSVCCAAIACSGNNKDWREPSGGVIDDGSIDPNNPNGDLPFYYPEGTEPESPDENADCYTIYTVSMGGLPISNVRVTVSKNDNVVVEGITQNGGLKFPGLPFDNYELSYSDLPQGYFEDKETVYNLTEDQMVVTTRFNSAVINSNMPAGHQYNMGDVMYNFRYTNANDVEVVLSELLQTKKLVVLNFWATYCGPCAGEFPAINRVYKQYKNDVEVIALSVFSDDTNYIIENYRVNFPDPLEFFMAYDNLNLAASLGGKENVPTTIFIDRYGVIAYRNVGAEFSDLSWKEAFDKYTSDDYQQNIEQGSGGITEDGERLAPYDFLEFEAISDNAFNQAFLSESMINDGYSLKYTGPEQGTSDAAVNWPFQVRETEADGMYIAPTNVGFYTHQGKQYATNYTWSILYTKVHLEADETLSVEVKLNTESGNDQLCIFLNNSTVNAYYGSGSTDGKWQKITLVSVTRPTDLNISIMYLKNPSGTAPDEFVGLRNLKITGIDYGSNVPVDLHGELWDEANGYKRVYLANDGFYRVKEGDKINPDTDSLLFVDIIFETLWNDRHLDNFTLRNEDGQGLTPSIYSIAFWLFGNGSTDFGFNGGNTIIDCYYVQEGPDWLSPVTEEVKQALDNFAKYAHNNSKLFGGSYFGEYTENTWLELCTYYRTFVGDHTAKGHVCKAHTNTGAGLIPQYAFPLGPGITHVNTTIATSVNFSGGTFYKLEAFAGAGVYRIKSISKGRIDPKIYVWSATQNPANSRPLIEQDESVGVERFETGSTDFNAFIYLKAGEYVYPQLTTFSIDEPGEYDVEVEYLGTEYWQLRTASTDNGRWLGTSTDNAVYAAIPTIMGGPNNDTHYHALGGGDAGSVVYIDFIRANYFYRETGLTLRDCINNGLFKAISDTYDTIIRGYLAKATAKAENDETYGMVEASNELVMILSSFITRYSQDNDDGYTTGYWKAFAFYYEYYGAREWNVMPDGWSTRNAD